MKNVSTTTKLRKANKLVKELAESNEKLEKELKSSNSVKDVYKKEKDKFGSEIEQLHQVLDAVNCPLPRKTKDPERSWSDIENSVASRLMSLFARSAGIGGTYRKTTDVSEEVEQ